MNLALTVFALITLTLLTGACEALLCDSDVPTRRAPKSAFAASLVGVLVWAALLAPLFLSHA